MKLSIVIPCYNEIDKIPKLREELLPIVEQLAASYQVEVVFVDDGSRDGTLAAIQENFKVDQIPQSYLVFKQHETNKGLGAALRTGFSAVTGDLIVTTDSDGTYKFSTIPAMVKALGEADFVTASPYHPDGRVVGVPAYRLILSKGSSMIYRLLVDWRIHTYTCLFRAYRREVIDQIQFQSDGFLAGTELMVKAMLKGYKVKEFPAELYRRMFGASKAKLMRTIMAHLKFQGRVLLSKVHLGSLATLTVIFVIIQCYLFVSG
jgi:dolichol-phosphate mannosyltransferase